MKFFKIIFLFLNTFDIPKNQDQFELPYLYWIPKLHKNPYEQRYIAGSNKCSSGHFRNRGQRTADSGQLTSNNRRPSRSVYKHVFEFVFDVLTTDFTHASDSYLYCVHEGDLSR
jgi:hypothetical protein